MKEFEKAAHCLGEPPSLLISETKIKAEFFILGDISKNLFLLYQLSFLPLLEMSSKEFNSQTDKRRANFNKIVLNNISKLKNK